MSHEIIIKHKIERLRFQLISQGFNINIYQIIEDINKTQKEQSDPKSSRIQDLILAMNYSRSKGFKDEPREDLGVLTNVDCWYVHREIIDLEELQPRTDGKYTLPFSKELKVQRALALAQREGYQKQFNDY